MPDTLQVTHNLPARTDSLSEIAFSGIGGGTLRAYRGDWEYFAAYLGKPSVEEAARYLVAAGQGETTRLVRAFRQAMIEAENAPGSINRRMCAIRYMFTALRRCAVVHWGIEVPGVKVQTLRDTRGPREETYRKMLAAVQGKPDHVLALVLLHDMALRRNEVYLLTMDDVKTDENGTRIMVRGKGKLEKVAYKAPATVVDALREWIAIRGDAPGNLLQMSYEKIRRLTIAAGKLAGNYYVTPHGLRHAGITQAAKILKGDAVRLQKYARHKNLSTTMRYVDDWEDTYGQVAEMVAKG